MKKLFILLVTAVSFLAANTYAVGNKQADKQQKIAVVDWREALVQSTIAAVEMKQIEDFLAGEQKKLKQQKDSLSTEQEKLKQDLEIMTQSDKEKAQQAFVNKVQEYNLMVRQLQQQQVQKENELFESMRPHINEAIDRVVERDAYDLVLNKSTLAFFNPAYDITEKVIKELNSIKLKEK